MRVEYTEPSPSDADSPCEAPGPPSATAVLDQELANRVEGERPAADWRPTVG
jgi:hypothetical protein